MTGRHRVYGLGSDLAIEVEGPDIAACLAAAVRGVAESLVADHPPEAAREEPIVLRAATPAELLLELVEEVIVRLDADGELSVDLREPSVDGTTLHGRLVLVALSEVEVHGAAPKAATWHRLRLEEAGDGWAGFVMLDL